MEARPTRVVNRQVGLAVRAPRVAVLIRQDADWTTCLSLVQTLTETWGGATFAIIPTDGQRIRREFWRLLRLHDPDWFAKFGDVPFSDRLEQQLMARHSVALPDHDQVDQIWPGNVGYPLTSVSAACQDGLTLGRVTALSIEADPITQLLLYSSTGCLSQEEIRQLNGANVEVQEDEVLPTIGGLLSLSSQLWAPARGHFGTYYPISLATMGLGSYVPPREMRRAPVVMVCGQTIADFAYFWTLRSVSGLPPNSPVFWLPRIDPELESSPEAAAMWRCQANALASRRRRHTENPWIATSLSMEAESLADLSSSAPSSV